MAMMPTRAKKSICLSTLPASGSTTPTATACTAQLSSCASAAPWQRPTSTGLCRPTTPSPATSTIRTLTTDTPTTTRFTATAGVPRCHRQEAPGHTTPTTCALPTLPPLCLQNPSLLVSTTHRQLTDTDISVATAALR